MVVFNEVVDVRGQACSDDQRVRRRKFLVGAKMRGVLRNLKVDGHAVRLGCVRRNASTV